MGLVTGKGGHLSATLEVVENKGQGKEGKILPNKQRPHTKKTNQFNNHNKSNHSNSNNNNKGASDSTPCDLALVSLHCHRGLSARLIKYIDLATGLQAHTHTRTHTHTHTHT